MVFSLFCVIFFVVFCVELFLLNRGNGAAEAPVISNNEPSERPDDDRLGLIDPWDESGTDGNDPFGDPTDNNLPGSPATPPLTATRQSLILSLGVSELIFYVDMELFERTEEVVGSIFFRHLPDRDSWIELSFAAINPQDGVSVIANGFLDNNLGGAESNIEGERSIGNSPVRGTFITGETAGGETYSAWLRSLADFGEERLALVVVIRYRNDFERSLIYGILDTMYINMLTATPPDDNDNGDDDNDNNGDDE